MFGDYASGAAPKGGWSVPPGQYGLIASYADLFLAHGPAAISWTALMPAQGDADQTPLLANFFIVDVRSTTVFSAGHLAGAVNIPYADLAKPWNLAVLPTDQPILVVCASGPMSAQGAAILGMLGYNARFLLGGMAVPIAAGYTLVTGQ